MIVLSASPSAVYQSSALDRVTCFIIGFTYPDPSAPNKYYQLYDKFWNGTQWQWETQGGPYQFNPQAELTTSPSPVYDPNLDRVTAFVTGGENDGRLYDVFWNGTKWQWENQGAPASPPGSSVATFAQFAPSSVYQSSLQRSTRSSSGAGLSLRVRTNSSISFTSNFGMRIGNNGGGKT